MQNHLMWSNESIDGMHIQVELSDIVTGPVVDSEVSSINNGSHMICFYHR